MTKKYFPTYTSEGQREAWLTMAPSSEHSNQILWNVLIQTRTLIAHSQESLASLNKKKSFKYAPFQDTMHFVRPFFFFYQFNVEFYSFKFGSKSYFKFHLNLPFRSLQLTVLNLIQILISVKQIAFKK